MHVVISGGTGLAGSILTRKLTEKGHTVTILTRNSENKQNEPSVQYVNWLDGSHPEKSLENVDAIVNLAGASISKAWTRDHKKAILNSRIDATRECVRIMKSLPKAPSVFFSTSAIGYYGISETKTFDESSRPAEPYFLQEVCMEWEKEAEKADDLTRLVIGRMGLILDKSTGALPKMMLPYRLGFGGPIGNGKQWYSWVHHEDAAEMILYALLNEQCRGVMNLTAPEPLQMKDFGKTMGTVLKRPHWLPVPGFMLRLMLGEMSDLVVKGQRVVPTQTEQFGYTYHYPTLESALDDIFK
ncbi:cell division inhibitor [Geomicrobium sp. JCM 19037]|uniref:TIGR01777 family oxidoreductase n=1 Tax=Geomicrobium sp. JCM 19037 TaxID=1460634 RepID=UPI00045F4386|nr:TIGR01777 family oxidoreductase [Geomicrobium sp. JCM 19037]GAK06003.1 cell division inhibitor [Geomicrobium sp. JCM 19037]